MTNRTETVETRTVVSARCSCGATADGQPDELAEQWARTHAAAGGMATVTTTVTTTTLAVFR